MGLTLKKVGDNPTWHKIELDGGSFEVQLGRPTHEALFDAYMSRSGGSEALVRVESVVRDWRGVDGEDGKPLPYSYEKLCELVVAYPAIVHQLTGLVYAKSAGLTEEQEKNSVSPPEDSSCAASNPTSGETSSPSGE